MADDHFFADWLNKQMELQKLSQGALARKAGLTKSVISRLCSRQVVKPEVSTYSAIAKALGVPLITVLREAGFEAPDSELPELDEFKYVLQQLSPEGRFMALAVLKAMLASASQVKGVGRE